MIALNRVPRVGAAKVRSLERAFGALEEAVRATPTQIAELCKDIGPQLAEEIADALRSDFAEREEERAARANVRILTWLDAAYPDTLRDLASAPLCLYCAGEVALLRQTQVAIVGTRAASVYGAEQARRFAHRLAQAGIHVTSGLAEGIDSAAHEGALLAAAEGPGRTLAAVGTALDCLYPSSRKPLARDIARSGGLVLSEYPFGRHGDAKTFPQRNRLIAALARATLIVETAARGGTLITADFAKDFGRALYAIPGRVDWPGFAGNHKLLRDGDARLVTSPEHILEDFGTLDLGDPLALGEPSADPIGLSPDEKRVWDAIGTDECSLDQLAQRTGLPLPALTATVIALQMQRRLRPLPGGLLRRA